MLLFFFPFGKTALSQGFLYKYGNWILKDFNRFRQIFLPVFLLVTLFV
jgi:hypothetical protein